MPPPTMTTLACPGSAIGLNPRSARTDSSSSRRIDGRQHVRPVELHGETSADFGIDGFGDVRREVVAENFLDLRHRPLRDVESTLLIPLVGTLAVADARIEVLGLHQLQRLIAAEEMTRPVETDVLDRLEGQA